MTRLLQDIEIGSMTANKAILNVSTSKEQRHPTLGGCLDLLKISGFSDFPATKKSSSRILETFAGKLDLTATLFFPQTLGSGSLEYPVKAHPRFSFNFRPARKFIDYNNISSVTFHDETCVFL